MRINIQLLICTFFYGVGLFSVTFEEELPDSYPEVYHSCELLPETPEKIKGWKVYEFYFNELFKKKQINRVIEVGVWLGNWTTYIGSLTNDDCKIYAVDHWIGPNEFQDNPYYKQFLPTLYPQFLSNVIHKNLQDKIIPVRMCSLDAAKLFNKYKIKADLIYIDADHLYESVTNDLREWYPILGKDGIFCGDDWHFGGVRQAVMEFAKEKGLEIYVYDNFWSFYPLDVQPSY